MNLYLIQLSMYLNMQPKKKEKKRNDHNEMYQEAVSVIVSQG